MKEDTKEFLFVAGLIIAAQTIGYLIGKGIL